MTETKNLTKEEQKLYEEAKVQAKKIRMFFISAVQMDNEMLKSTRSSLASSISTYEAIGIMDGIAYTTKLTQYRAKYSRLDSMIKFIDVLKDTNEILQEDPNEGLDISGMLGL